MGREKITLCILAMITSGIYAESVSTIITSPVKFQTAQINVEKTGVPGEGIDISDNYNNWPNPFLPNFTPAKGVTLPGLDRSNKCNWSVVNAASKAVDTGKTPFIWGPTTEQSILNGTFGNPNVQAANDKPYICSTGGAVTHITNSDVSIWEKSYNGASVLQPQITFTDFQGKIQTVNVTLGFGHGVGYYDSKSETTINLECGQVALVRQCKDQNEVYTKNDCGNFEYIAVMRTGAIAWSYEITQPASTKLAGDNYGGTCYIPQAVLLPDSNVKDIVSQLEKVEGK